MARRGTDALIKAPSQVSRTFAILLMAVVVVSGVYVVSPSWAATNQLYLSPASGTVLQNNTVDVAVRMDSGSDPVNAVQANLSYDPAKLEFMSINSAGTAFPLEAQGTGGGGTVTIARATNGGAPPATGDQLVATVTFKALVGSGTADVAFANGSAVVRSTDNVNILVSSAGASFTLGTAPTPTPTATPAPTATPTPTPVPTPGPTPTPTPTPASTPTPTPAPSGTTLYLSPASATTTVGSDVVFTIKENSGADAVNAVQANFNYSTSYFQFVSITADTSDFGLEATQTGDNGQIRVARGTSAGTPAVTGDKVVATVTLKAIAAGTWTITAASGSAVVRAADTVNVMTSQTGATVTVTGGQSGGAAPTPVPTPIQVPAPISVIGSKKPVPVKKKVTVTAPALPKTAQVTYAVDGQPTTETIDTTKLSEGEHTITATSTDANGNKRQVQQKVNVQNKQPTYTGVLGAVTQVAPWAGLALAVIVFGIVGYAIYHRRQMNLAAVSGGAGSAEGSGSSGNVFLPEDDGSSK